MHNFYDVTWYTGVSVELAAVAVIICRGAVRHFPGVVAYCSWDLVFDLLLWLNAHSGQNAHTCKVHYFYLYWTWFAGSALLRFGVILDILDSFPGADFMMRELRIFVGATGTVMACGAWRMASLDKSTQVRGAAVSLDSSALLAVGAFAVATLLAIHTSQLKWSEAGRRIAIGFCIKSLTGVLIAKLLIATEAQQRLGKVLTSLAALTCIVLWLWATLARDLTESEGVRETNTDAARLHLSHHSPEKADIPCT